MKHAGRADYWATAPELLKPLGGVNEALGGGTLDQRLRRLLELRVSQINGCAYCCVLHARQLRELGESQVRIDALPAWAEAGLFDDAERAALAWAEALTRIHERGAPDELYAAVREHYSERQLVEISLAVSMMNLWNRMSVGFGRRVER